MPMPASELSSWKLFEGISWVQIRENKKRVFIKMGQHRPLFKQTSLQFLQKINVKKCQVNPVYSTGIWTHDLWYIS